MYDRRITPSQAEFDDRRRHPRRAVKVPVFVRLGAGVVHKWVAIETGNVSNGGLYFETGRELPIDAEACIMVGRLGGGVPDSAQIEARVAHSRLDAASGRHCVGLEFQRLIDVTNEQLVARIESWSEEAEGA